MLTTIEAQMSRYVVDANGCWIWQGATSSKGYGRVRVAGKVEFAHRVSYRLHIGEIPDGLELDHLCRVRNCIRPDHLEPVTHRENMERGTMWDARRAITHCPRGHAYDEANTAIIRGCRRCRRCQAEKQAARRRRAREG